MSQQHETIVKAVFFRDPELWRFTLVAVALLAYGLLSAPAPQDFGSGELLVAVLMTFAVGIGRPAAFATGALLIHPTLRYRDTVGCVVFFLLLWLPLLRGVILEWETRTILRDILPLVFLFLPVLLVRERGFHSRRPVDILAGGLAAAGLAFTLRWWAGTGWAFGAIGLHPLSDGSQYLLNSPTVLFAALWLPIVAVTLLWPELAGPRLKTLKPMVRYALALLFLSLAVPIEAALAATVHRMALGMVAGSGLLFLIWCSRRTPGPALLAAAGLSAVLIAVGGPLTGALEMVAIKSQQVGWNERFAEMDAVLTQLGRSLLSLLFGDGWGTLVANPAVGGWRVSYTHSFATYLLLKTGIAGALTMLCWLAALAPSALRLLRYDTPLALAALPPVLGGLLLHTSFKYLCFGLLLTLVVSAAETTPDPPPSRQ
ncbi:MAG: hypothetical protein WCF85_01630 [Rhodospirillaceae bacterium]